MPQLKHEAFFLTNDEHDVIPVLNKMAKLASDMPAISSGHDKETQTFEKHLLGILAFNFRLDPANGLQERTFNDTTYTVRTDQVLSEYTHDASDATTWCIAILINSGVPYSTHVATSIWTIVPTPEEARYGIQEIIGRERNELFQKVRRLLSAIDERK